MENTTTLERVSLAIVELAKGLKAVTFYPAGHPALIQALSKIVALFEEIPLPEAGLEIGVTKGALLYLDTPVASSNKAVIDLNRELYLRRASKVIFLPGMKPEETAEFLSTLARDVEEIQDRGGLERILRRKKISRIWVNRVDYEGLTEMLKTEDELEGGPDLSLKSDDLLQDLAATPPDEASIDAILTRIENETDPAAYRDHIIAFSRALAGERPDRKLECAARALAIFAAHVARPPRQSDEIARLAALGIREIATDEMIDHVIGRIRDRGGRGRRDAESILVAVGERAVKPLLSALAGDEDLIVRKTIIDVVIRIGRPAVPALLDNLTNSRWYIVRNMVTILGSLGLPDVAPSVATVLSHPDLRVKKEAIKALARLPHPSAVQSLGELCFFPEETVALTATAALAAKKEPESVLALYRRATSKRIAFPHFRLAHEAIDSLRAIGTDEAISALEDVLRARFLYETKKVRGLKIHAIRSISRIEGPRPRDVLGKASGEGPDYLRWEAERLLKKGER